MTDIYNPPVDDQALAERLRTGDTSAFTALVERYQAPMHRVALRQTGSAALADEVVQETWLSAIRAIDTFEGRSTLKTWLFRILLNEARTRRSRERRSVAGGSFSDGTMLLHRDGAEWRGPVHGCLLGPEPSTVDEPEARAVDADLVREVRRAIRGLPRAQRAVIELRDLRGVSAVETCRRLGVTPEHQRVLLHRARAAVRREVAPER